MDLYTILSSKQDLRKGAYECSFNGYLEDYVELQEDEELKKKFVSILENNKDLRIITNVKFKVSEESVSNAIIRYKDIYKLKNKAVIVPYFLYSKDKAILLADEYIYAKAMYYSLTEKGGELENNKNDLVALCLDDDISATLEIFEVNKTGKIQRNADSMHFNKYIDGYNKALELSNEIQETYISKTKETKQKEKYISSCVSRWYLLKKFVYVSYMVDKDILKKEFDNDVKKQRTKAKEYSDSIKYTPMSKMWEEIKKK